MSEENVEVVRRIFKAWEERDPEAALSHIHPNVEVDLTAAPPIWGDQEIRHGHDGLRQAISDWLEAWESLEFSPKNFIDAGGDVVVWLRLTARGRGSGVLTERHGASVYSFQDGRVIRWRAFDTLAQATSAAGI